MKKSPLYLGTVSVGDTALVKLDLTKWTLKQNRIIIPLLRPIFEKAVIAKSNDDSANIVLGLDLLELGTEADILALLWLNEDETKFYETTYQARVDLINDCTLTELEELRVAYEGFFDTVMKSIMASSQIYGKMLGQ